MFNFKINLNTKNDIDSYYLKKLRNRARWHVNGSFKGSGVSVKQNGNKNAVISFKADKMTANNVVKSLKRCKRVSGLTVAVQN
jgi:hypothetical protein